MMGIELDKKVIVTLAVGNLKPCFIYFGMHAGDTTAYKIYSLP